MVNEMKNVLVIGASGGMGKSIVSKLINEGYNVFGLDIAPNPNIEKLKYHQCDIRSEEQLNNIFRSKKSKIDIAIDILCYCTKSQLFTDGNKRTAVIACNHYLLNNGLGYLSINFNDDAKFKTYLIAYYENKDNNIKNFLRKRCFHSIDKKTL